MGPLYRKPTEPHVFFFHIFWPSVSPFGKNSIGWGWWPWPSPFRRPLRWTLIARSSWAGRRPWSAVMRNRFIWCHMVVSWNGGTSKSSIVVGFSIINQQFFGYQICRIMGKSTISMAIFYSKLWVYQRVCLLVWSIINVNPGWINHGLLTRGYSPNSHNMIIINGNPQWNIRFINPGLTLYNVKWK